MRRAFAIVLLLVFGLYHVGYYGFYLIANEQSDHYWQHLTHHAEINEENLLHMAIPLAIPYQRNQLEYQPANGKVEVDGNYYRVVRQKYANDTLHVVYTVDTRQQKIEQSIDKWIASMLSVPMPESDADSMHMWKSLAKDFLVNQMLSLENPIRILRYHSCYGDLVVHRYEYITVIPLPPPERV